jgi:uncharacterized protein YigE (DUF2233 family)
METETFFVVNERVYSFDGREDSSKGRTGLNINKRGVYYFEAAGRKIVFYSWASVSIFNTNDPNFMHYLMNGKI